MTNIFEVVDNFKKKQMIRSNILSGRREDKGVDISICIPTYDRVDMLYESLCSCINMQKSDLAIEIIVVDNNTIQYNPNYELICKMNSDLGLNINYYQNDNNLGMFGNWNRCISLASGRWVSILHDDDVLFENTANRWEEWIKKLEQYNVVYLKSLPINFTIFKDMPSSNSRKRYDVLANFFDFVFMGNPGFFGAPTAGVLLKRESFLEIGGYNPDFYPSDDAFCIARLKFRGFNVAYTTEPLGGYRQAANASMNFETQIEWVKRMIEYQNSLIHFGGFIGAYTKFFENQEITTFVDDHLKSWGLDNKGWDKIREYMESNGRRLVPNTFKYYLFKVFRKLYFFSFYHRRGF